MNFNKLALIQAIENVAIIAGATIAAIHFGRPSLLWWYLLILLNHSRFEYTREVNKDENRDN